MILDLSVTPTNAEIDELVDTACNLLHQNGSHVLLLYKARYGGQSVKSQLGAQRRVEDRLLANGVNMECEVSLAYEVANRHGNDRRPLGGRVQLCFSDKAGQENVPRLLQGKGAQGSITDIPLLRAREMRRLQPPGELGDGTEGYNLSPAARCAHRGSAAAERMLQCLLQDSGLDSGNSHLDILELTTSNTGDWSEACFRMQLKKPTDTKLPFIYHLGLTRESDAEKAVQSHLEALLMQEWWPLQPDAGPAEPANAMGTEKPDLILGSFVDGRPQISDLVAGKFDEDRPVKVSQKRKRGGSQRDPRRERCVDKEIERQNRCVEQKE